MTTTVLEKSNDVLPYEGNIIEQQRRLTDEINSYWLPISIILNQFNQSTSLPYNVKELKGIDFHIYDIRTGKVIHTISMYSLASLTVRGAGDPEYFTLLRYLDKVPEIGTNAPSPYVEYFTSLGGFDGFLDTRLNSIWKQGYDFSYLSVKLNEKGEIIFASNELLQSLHESFTTKTPPKVPIQIMTETDSQLEDWKPFLSPMGLDIYSVCCPLVAGRGCTYRFYITNVHRLVDLETQVPPKILKGVLDRSNELIDKFNIPGLSHYRTSKTAWKKKRVSEPTWSDTSSLQPSFLKGSLTSVLNIEDSDTKLVIGLLTLCLFVPVLAYLLGK